MSLSRRRFVQTVSAGAAGLWVAGRGREAGLFDLNFEAASRAGRTPADGPMILASNENPLGPRQGGARRRARRLRRARPLSVRHHGGSRRAHRQEARRQAGERAPRIGLDPDPAHHHAHLLLEDRTAHRADAGLRRVRGLRGAHGLSGAHREAHAAARAQDGRGRHSHRRQGRRDGVLLQPEQPGRHRRRRQDHARLHRGAGQELAEHARRSWTRRTSSTPRCRATRR